MLTADLPPEEPEWFTPVPYATWRATVDGALRAELADAEARGYARAVAKLRDDEAYWAWQRDLARYDGSRHEAADYLESRNDHER